jgi:DNA processing protein
MHSERWYQIALTLIPHTGPVLRKRLIAGFGSASAVFSASRKELKGVEGISENAARQILEWNNFNAVDSEIRFIEKQQIQPLFITDPAYPQRLLQCPDPPTLLYWKGQANLNAARVISIIGTRTNSPYGKQVTEILISSLPEDVLIVSGMAFGIDAIAHKAALNNQLRTVGVLAHGLDDLYPAQHWGLAKEMQHRGGLLTEFNQNTRADKYNFPRRNRIVAGMADATIVIETAAKGGSMITADLAFDYNRELFAVPGRLNDPKSEGCLKLIVQNKAALYTSAGSLLETMGWGEEKIKQKALVEIMAALSEEEQQILRILKDKIPFTIDDLQHKAGLNSSRMAAALLNLEMQQLIQIIPGKMIALT